MGGFGAFRLQIEELARAQHAAVARRQLIGLGLTGRQVERGIARGELRIIHRGVYLVGPSIPPHAREVAAVLACGQRAVVSHVSAAHLYGLLPYPAEPGRVHVTVWGRRPRGDAGIVVHRTGSLLHHEIRERQGVPVTAPLRTLLDFAASCSEEELERAVAEAFALRLTQRAPLLREVDRQRGKRGTARLRALLEGDGPKRTRSAPERRLLNLLRAAGLPPPRTNIRVGRWEVDFYWPLQGLVVEVDAYSTHSSPSAFERDRRKDGELAALGLIVHRVTRRQIEDGPAAVVAGIRRFLTRGAPKTP